MFDYNLKGKEVVISLDEEFLPYLKPYGIMGSPLYAKVFKMEEGGLWLETTSFSLCPRGVPKLYKPSGGQFCRAHIFVPSKAVVSVVTFPGKNNPLQADPNLKRIGFKPRPRRKVRF